MKKSTGWIVLIYGLLVAALGCLGYYKTQSKPSLIAGVAAGATLMLSSFWLFKKSRGALFFVFITVLSLTALFCYRYAVTRANIPALLSLLSASVLIYLLLQIARWRHL
jgi:uncharacterized membrane protein (UPF0136 family)